jgi:hypothetical protein
MEGFLFDKERHWRTFFTLLKWRRIFEDHYLVKVAHLKNEKKKRRWFSFRLSV